MILRNGFQTFEFQQALELQKLLSFATYDDALNWLKNLGLLDFGRAAQLRACLARHAGDSESYRLTDHEAIERMAHLLYSRSVVVVVREQRGSGSGQAKAKTSSPGPAFSLAERVPSTPTVTSAPPVNDPPTFNPKVAAAAQAAALVAAAADGKPFCPE